MDSGEILADGKSSDVGTVVSMHIHRFSSELYVFVSEYTAGTAAISGELAILNMNTLVAGKKVVLTGLYSSSFALLDNYWACFAGNRVSGPKSAFLSKTPTTFLENDDAINYNYTITDPSNIAS